MPQDTVQINVQLWIK